MIRRKLLIATAIIASVVLTACSDMTGPKSNAACPVLTGSSICPVKIGASCPSFFRLRGSHRSLAQF